MFTIAATAKAKAHMCGAPNRRWLSSLLATREALKLVETKTIGRKAIARVPLKAGTVINEFTQPVLGRPTMHTVQLDETVHVAPTEGAEFISHWCSDTNTRIVVAEDRRSAQFVVTQDVEEGEDLSFNYNTTEWDMNSPFQCACPSCQARPEGPRLVRGFRHLTLDERTEILDETSPLILARSQAEAASYLKLVSEVRADGDRLYYATELEQESKEAAQ